VVVCSIPDLDSEDLSLDCELAGFGCQGAIFRGTSKTHGIVAVKFFKDQNNLNLVEQ
jgi:hypothetical protein